MDDKARLFHEYKIKHNQLIEALDALENMVRQHCQLGDTIESDSAFGRKTNLKNAAAIHLLAKHGRLTITADFFPRVIGKWIAKEERDAPEQAHEAVEGSQEG